MLFRNRTILTSFNTNGVSISRSCKNNKEKKLFNAPPKASCLQSTSTRIYWNNKEVGLILGGYGIHQFKFFETRHCCLAPVGNLRHKVKLNYFKTPKHVTLHLKSGNLKTALGKLPARNLSEFVQYRIYIAGKHAIFPVSLLSDVCGLHGVVWRTERAV